MSTLSSLGPGASVRSARVSATPTMAVRLLAGIEVDSAAPAHAMWELGRAANVSTAISAAFEAGPDEVIARLEATGSDEARDYLVQFSQFLRDYGSRGQNEYDPCAPSWEVRPRIALAAIDLMRKSDESQAPAIRQASSVAERDRVAAEIREKLAGDAATAGLFEAALRSAQLFLAGRERAKTNCVMVINELRMALYEYGHRLVERGLIDQVAAGVHGHRRGARPASCRPRVVPRRDRRALGAVQVGCSTTSPCSSSTGACRASTR